MTSIGASTTHTVKVKRTGPSVSVGRTKKSVASKLKPAPGRRGSVPSTLRPATLNKPDAIEKLRALDEEAQKEYVADLLRQALGEQAHANLSAPRAASTTRDRAGAAADVAVAAKELGLVFVLKHCGVLEQMKRMLFPDGLDALFSRTETMSLKPSASSVSLASMDDTTTVTSFGTDSKRGKTTPANAREGSLLLVRALCEGLARIAEPFVVGGFLAAALDECGSTSSSVRQAAEDTSTALVALAHPWALPRLVCPVLVQSLHSTEWRVKYNSLERLAQCAKLHPVQMCSLLPGLIPTITSQVWDTKPQVTKAAGTTLLAMCQTNQNPDVAPAIPAVVAAICKPSETVTAIQELMATTFVAPVDAPTLSILCPVLSRGLKEKLAINKRSACIVISNMSRLVDSPEAVAPFGPLLVPELQKVAHNVQFEEIRDAALSALSNLTKALGESTKEADVMQQENARVEDEQKRIAQEREEEAKRDEAKKIKEEEERKKFKEAMDAQRELDKLAIKDEEEKKAQELKKREQQKLSTKSAGGKCQGCGLKKCKKSCLFYSG